MTKRSLPIASEPVRPASAAPSVVLPVSWAARVPLAALGLGLLAMGGIAGWVLLDPEFIDWEVAADWPAALLFGAFVLGALWGGAVTLAAAIRGRSRVWGGTRLRDLVGLVVLFGLAFWLFGRLPEWRETLVRTGVPEALASLVLWAGGFGLFFAVRAGAYWIAGRQRAVRGELLAVTEGSEARAPKQGPAV